MRGEVDVLGNDFAGLDTCCASGMGGGALKDTGCVCIEEGGVDCTTAAGWLVCACAVVDDPLGEGGLSNDEVLGEEVAASSGVAGTVEGAEAGTVRETGAEGEGE